MVDLEKLNAAIKDSGIKRSAVARRLGVSRTTLWKKLRGDIKISLSEANEIAAQLGMSEKQKVRIFLP